MAHLTIEGSIYDGFAVHGYCECHAGIKFNQNYCSVCGRKKDQNKKTGRKGFFDWKGTKITAIGPAAYGDYILQNKRRGKK